MTSPAIHHAGPDDWERVRAIRLRALADAPDAFWVRLEDETQRTPEQWRERLASPSSATFLATGDGETVGLVVTHPSTAAEGDAGLAAMWVAPEARGTGVADALISAGVGWARDRGYRRVRLWINDANAVAERLYERHGFVPTGVAGTFPPPREHITEHELMVDLATGSSTTSSLPS
jgi:GNAT superfamily N-acetyltransferase